MSTYHGKSLVLLAATPNTLMHASLAHLTPELLALDSTIGSPHPTKLPTELLLVIRSHLLPLLTSQLITESTAALQTYESSLQVLLCVDCASYNKEIYGPDVWQWEGFNGACECGSGSSAETENGRMNASDAIQSNSITNRRLKLGNSSRTVSVNTTVNPKQFLDAQHYLQFHLSRETRRLARRAHAVVNAWSQTPFAINTARVDDIWELVSLVLGGYYGCNVVFDFEYVTQGNATLSSGSPTRTQGGMMVELDGGDMQGRTSNDKPTAGPFSRLAKRDRHRYDRVYITPSPPSPSIDPEDKNFAKSLSSPLAPDCNNGIACADPEPWTSRAILSRTWRDLGLGLDYSNSSLPRSDSTVEQPHASESGGVGTVADAQDALVAGDRYWCDTDSGSGETAFTTSRGISDTMGDSERSSSSLTPVALSIFTDFQATEYESLVSFIHLVTAIVAACLAIPVTLASLALTVVCFYSRPRSFRVL